MASPSEPRNDEGGKPRPEIKVTDRRHFTATGERRGEFPEEAAEDPSQWPTPPGGTAESRSGAGFDRRPVREPDGVDFTMLINAMAQPALWLLGEVADPTTGRRETNLEQARLQIDMLDLLRVKCRGNLEPAEQELLERVLYQLRMLYVSKAGRLG